jgi:serine/threonine protein kinase
MNEETIFHLAREKPPEQRAAFLDEACGGDPALHQRLEILLAADEHPGSFLQLPLQYNGNGELDRNVGRSVFQLGVQQAPGTSIGPYKLVEKIGEGGMGVVFLAEQTEPLRRKVALKVIKPGMDTRQVIARFEAERQTLAVMDHPNIARVLDAGCTGSGRPYFVMELVKGQSITNYCDERHLTLRQRLELFLPVCQAIGHAHQKGIIHRDIKPTNVLVTLYEGGPVPKVIDFGVAKAITQNLAENTMFTGFGQLIGTLEYMSPEQAQFNQLDIDTRSDIYALGVVLYELLTGSTPFEQSVRNTAAVHETLRIIREVEPPKPSTRLSTDGSLPTIAANRSVAPTQLRSQVRGELDWIVMKALEKDRNRRYDSAGAFAADLQRYLHDEPVHACPPSAGYRLRKFVRHNRGPVLATSLVLLTLVGGIVGTTLGLIDAEQARHAEAKRAAGERLAKEIAEKRLVQIEKGIDILASIFENLDPQAEEKEGRPLRAILADRLDEAAAQVAGEAVGDPLVVARLQDRLGWTYLGLGHSAKAESLFTKSLATRIAELGEDHPDTLSSMHHLALAYGAAGNLDQAIERLEQVRDAQVKKLGTDHVDTLATCNHLGLAYRLAKRPAEAVALLTLVADARAKQLGANHPDTLSSQHHLAAAYRADGKPVEAVALFEHVREARVKRLGPEHPDTLTTLHHLGMAYRHVNQLSDAIAAHKQLSDIQIRRLGPDHPHTLTALNDLAWTYRFTGKATEAIALYEQVREARVQKLEADQQDAFITLNDLADTYLSAGKPEQAAPLYEQAAIAVEKRKFSHPRAHRIVQQLSHCQEFLGQYEQAELWRRKWLATIKVPAELDSFAYAEDLAALGWNLVKQEKFADAEPLLLQGYQGMKKREMGASPLERATLAIARERLVQFYEAWDKPDEAATWRRELEAVQVPAAK